MSEGTKDSIPTSSDRRSNRPTKKRALDPISKQSQEVEALFAHPDRTINLSPASKTRTLAAPPEIVTNVQGSSAGAGSGEFHVYKASRRREYERLRQMDEEVRKEDADREFDERSKERRREDEMKLGRNRAKREKAKMRALKKKGGGEGEKENAEDGGGDGGVVKKKLGPKVVVGSEGERKEEGLGAESGALEEDAGITIHDDD
ncbi:DUF1168-domain-containing protein [Teratosphaeria destructans]|uniref:DUF1168-domain-containing protein n=1 Tax=Teratosphaeria destructans TaxID=418781 RepID=A0A9W7ST18_9PEZI|nr:DUF1168-domain-containing protein [Teratosphaeria destructans]